LSENDKSKGCVYCYFGGVGESTNHQRARWPYTHATDPARVFQRSVLWWSWGVLLTTVNTQINQSIARQVFLRTASKLP
jgi:hypothetical protein